MPRPAIHPEEILADELTVVGEKLDWKSPSFRPGRQVPLGKQPTLI
jgi:hypothetical protein